MVWRGLFWLAFGAYLGQSSPVPWPAGSAWTACRASRVDAAAASRPGWAPGAAIAGDCVASAPVPGTVLEALLANGTFTEPNGTTPLRDPYVDDWLTRIPDIADAGRPFYTFVYAAQLATADVEACQAPVGASPAARVLLHLPQAAYHVTVHVDGGTAPLPPVGALAGTTAAIGMYRRFDFDLGPLDAFCASPAHAVSLLVAPPDVPGVPTGGQGGDKAIARNIVAQWTAGWDFSPPCPDRATGLFDGVFLDVAPGGVLLRDGAVAVTALALAPGDPARAATLSAVFRASLLALGSVPVAGSLACAVAGVAGAAWTGNVTVPGGSVWTEAGGAPPAALVDVPLWWPHTAGAPVLNDASCTFVPAGGSARDAATATWRAGFRTVTSSVNAQLGGRQFEVNGQRVYLEGGNFVGTDVLYRSAYRTPARYADEVRLHARMGFNVMRLWGGSGGHPSALWDAADAAGVLLFFEFWMTGDDNSPAKGGGGANASAPDDHAGYLETARDSLRAVRGRASLLLVCEGNEIWPVDVSPPPDIHRGLVAAVAALDPSGALPVIQTSAGSAAGVVFDPIRVLAPRDGPYSAQDSREYFKRNPGMGGDVATAIAFQPETGSYAYPDIESLSRFMSPGPREALPRRGASNGGGMYAVHNWLPCLDWWGRDHIYAYTARDGAGAGWAAADYLAAAGLAQQEEIKALYEGFANFMWEFYSGMMHWKSGSPWPSLRGAPYDWYLSTAGGFWGARAATEGGQALHVQFDRDWRIASARVAIVNRGLATVPAGALTATALAFDVSTGAEVPLSTPYAVPAPALPPQSVARLDGPAWPPSAHPGAVLLWRLTLRNASTGAVASVNEYALSSLTTDQSVAPNMTALAALRGARAPPAVAPVVSVAILPAGAAPPGEAGVTVTVTAPPLSAAVAVGVRVSLRCAATAVTAPTGFVDDRVLPQFADAGLFALAPGESRLVVVTARITGADLQGAHVLVDGWNVVATRANVTARGGESAK